MATTSAIAFAPAVTYNVGGPPVAIALGDLNGDHKLDLVTANGWADTISVLLGNGDGTFQPAVTTATGHDNRGVALGDVNGDGKLDLIVTYQDGIGGFMVFLGNGDGTFQGPVSHASPHGVFGGVAVGDFNGDGKLDVAAGEALGPGADHVGVEVFLGNGDGTFRAPNWYDVSNTYGGVSAVTAVDLNGDGKLDLIADNPDCNTYVNGGNIRVFLGVGDGTFSPGISYASGLCPGSVAIGDFNGDGKLDLAVTIQHGPFAPQRELWCSLAMATEPSRRERTS